jgi:hypothetical protein
MSCPSFVTIKWNNWASPQKAAEIYARTVSNFADNSIVTTRIANNAMFANMEALKTIIEHRRDDVKEFSRMAVNTAMLSLASILSIRKGYC